MSYSLKRYAVVAATFLALSNAAWADCTVFADRDFRGAKLVIGNFERVKMINGQSLGCSFGCWSTLYRPQWNDRISSYAVRRGCVLKMWEHVDARGWELTRTGNLSYIGDRRNDKVSEALCDCN